MRLAALPLILAATLAEAALHVAEAAPLAAHKAAYALTLKPTADQEVIAASGTMTYNVVDACTSWTTSQHLVIDITNKDGQDVKMVSDYATVEAKDGRRLEFHTKQVTDTAVTQQLDGTATLERSGKGAADYTSPERRQVLLPIGTLLPLAHTSAIIDAAEAGKKFLSVPLFDGTDASGAQDSFVTIEMWKPPAPQPWPTLSGLPFGRVHVAFFDRSTASETPSYEIGIQYFRNGVGASLAMNFGEFSMEGTLTQFQLQPPPRC